MRIGFYQTNLGDSVVLIGAKWGTRRRELLLAREDPDSDPVEEIDLKSNQGEKVRRAQSAKRIALKAQRARLKAQGKSLVVSSQ